MVAERVAERASWGAAHDNLNMPGALALTWELTCARSCRARPSCRYYSEFDEVLGLGASMTLVEAYQVPPGGSVRVWIEQRGPPSAGSGDYQEADAGFVLEMDKRGVRRLKIHGRTERRVRPKTPWEKRQERSGTVASSSSAEVPWPRPRARCHRCHDRESSRAITWTTLGAACRSALRSG